MKGRNLAEENGVKEQTPLQRLRAIGFVRAGTFAANDGTLRIDFCECGDRTHCLYAFVIGDEVMYVGKSVRRLRTRLHGYCKPSSTQATNVRNNRSILEARTAGREVIVYALPDNKLLSYGEFHVNLAAGLEDSIIKRLKPPWNGAKTGIDVPLVEGAGS